MSKNIGKGNGVRKRLGSGGDVLSTAIGNVRKALPGTLSLERDNAVRSRQRLWEELKARIEGLESQGQDFTSAEEVLFMGDEKFKQIIEMEAKQMEDRVVWKAYSKRGGINDTLADIRKAIEHPSANAYEFDEEEGMYTIFITLNNTYISRLLALCSETCRECERIREIEDSELQRERKELQVIYHNLCFEKKKLSQKLKFFQQQLKTISCVKGEEQEKELRRLENDLDSYERKRRSYADEFKTYQERLIFFAEKCGQQKAYASKYSALLGKLTELGEICREEHPFHMLTVSPEGEEELRQYMETACEFSKWTMHVTREYPL